MTPSQIHKSAALSIDAIFSCKIQLVSVAVSASRQWQTLLLAWRERDESLTWWWHDNRRSANGNLLFLGKASSVASKNVYRPSIFFFPHHYPFTLAVNKCPAIYILSPALDEFWRENRGSVNRLKFHAPEKALAIVTCTSKLTLSWEPSFDSRVFQNLYFL